MNALRLFVCALLAASAPAFAADAARPAPVAPPEPLGGVGLLQVAVALVLVLGMFFLLAFLLKRIGHRQGPHAGAIRLLAGIAVGQRERVVLVQVGEKQLLLGVAPGRVSLLHALEEGIDLEGPPRRERFSDKMAAFEKRGRPQS